MAANRLGFKHKKVQRLRRLIRQQSLREAEGVFVAEGIKLLSEALASGVDVEGIYLAPGAPADLEDLARRSGVRIHLLDEGVMERTAGTVTPQPVVSVVKAPVASLDALAGASAVAVLVDVRDPGNAGTILRSAEASGVGAVVFCEGSVDPFNPKTVRSSAGAIFHVPVVKNEPVDAVLRALRNSAVAAVGTAGDAPNLYDQFDMTKPVAIFVGNEANGLPAAVQQRLDSTVSIPIEGRSESLNAGVAFAVVAFEMARQRRAAK